MIYVEIELYETYTYCQSLKEKIAKGRKRPCIR